MTVTAPLDITPTRIDALRLVASGKVRNTDTGFITPPGINQNDWQWMRDNHLVEVTTRGPGLKPWNLTPAGNAVLEATR